MFMMMMLMTRIFIKVGIMIPVLWFY